jgi:hypothetical protein
MKDKRGQELSTNTIIIIILAVVVLVVLVLGFAIGWEKILPFTSQPNIDTIKTACATACSTGSTYDFCSIQREVKDGINDKFKETCYALANNAAYSSRNYGIDKCPSITCGTA